MPSLKDLKLADEADKLADDLGRGHYSMSEAIRMIRRLVNALRKTK